MEKEIVKELKSIKHELQAQNDILKKLAAAVADGLTGIKKEISDL